MLASNFRKPPEDAHRYAGIGSRQITAAEAVAIRNLSKKLAARGFWLYSGNATGADQAFQEGAGSKAIAFLPHAGYNRGICPQTQRCQTITKEAIATARQLHPKGDSLSEHSLAMMARNVQIIEGIPGLPRVEFVLCCADPDGQGVAGGSAMGWKVARRHGIPFLNLRVPGWEARLDALLATFPPP